MIAIIDYGVGNLRSVQKAFERIGAEAVVTSDAAAVSAAEGVVLPGVGAFGDAMRNLRRMGLAEATGDAIAEGRPFLGICLGMQLIFEESEEMGVHRGLGVFRGVVQRFPKPPGTAPNPYKVPHIGWNEIHIRQPSPLLEGITDGSFTYFVHSYYVALEDPAIVLATTDYGLDFASIVGRDNVFGIQFHPEKSQDVGLRILKNFAAIVRGGGE